MKQRVIGALVLAALLAIFLPMFFSNPHPASQLHLASNLPKEPPAPTITLTLPQAQKQQQALVVKPPVQSSDNKLTTQPVQQVAVKSDKSNKSNKPAPITKKVVAHTQPAASAHAGWILQVAAYKNKANADRMYRKLKADSIGSKAALVNHNNLTQVVLGPYATRAQAKSIQQQLHKTYQLQGLIKRQRS